MALVGIRLPGKSLGLPALGLAGGLSVLQTVFPAIALLPRPDAAFLLVEDLRSLYAAPSA